MPRTQDFVYIGIKGQVLALDRTTGQQVWAARVKGSFVNLVLDGDRLLASGSGELYCLDAITGAQVWHNQLPGMGMGLMSIVTANAPGGNVANAHAQIEADEAAANAAVIPAI